MKIQLAVINKSDVPDTEVARATAAMQKQVSGDFAPLWGVDCDLTFYAGPRARPPASAWQLVIANDSDEAGALGYHDLTRAGQPLGKVFVRSTLAAGGLWSVTFSHEVLEILIDPNINLCAFDESAGRLYAYEVCDAVEADGLAYKIDGVWVSDFVLPGWFEPLRVTKGERFAFKSKVRKPFALLPGGYISYFDLAGGHGWQQISARHALDADARAYHTRARVGSRRERRRTPKADWLRSVSG